MQPGSPRSFRYRPAWIEKQQQAYRQIQALRPELILVGGDLTRDGSIHDYELEEARRNLDALAIPYRAIPGNMDTGNKHTRVQGCRTDRDDQACNVTSQQLRNFARYFGEFPWTFVHKDVRFSGFYAAVAGSGLPEEKVFWDFLEGLGRLPAARHHVAMMHYPLFIDRMDEPNFSITDPENYINWYFCIDQPHRGRIFELLKKAGVEIILSGHIHCRRPVQVIDGVRLYKTAATGFGQWEGRWADGDTTLGFMRFEVSESGIEPEFVPLEKVSTRKDGYGPGGHPKAEARDYSLAWEK
jgi:predicted MPP superfamily phosphohydrolase